MKYRLNLTPITLLLLVLFSSNALNAQEIDSSYGLNGFLPYGGIMANSEANKGIGYSSVVQPDGKVVVAIDKADLNGPTDLFYYTYRYNSNGTPDSSFGTAGVSKVFAGDHSRSYDIQLQADGKILLTGETKYCVNGICGASQLVVIRLKPNGQADSTFGSEGKIITSDIFGASGTFAIPKKVNLLPNGSIILGGRGINGKPFISKLNPNGYPDFSFAQNGVFTEDLSFSSTLDIKTDPSGNAYALIWVYNYINSNIDSLNPTDIRIIKLNPNGQPDNTFGVNGKVNLNFVPDDSPVAIQPMSDGSVLLIGQNWISRILSNGSIASDFPSGFSSFGSSFTEPVSFQKIISLSNSRYLICGSLRPQINGNYHEKALLLMSDATGNVDTSFNGNGYMVFDYGMIGPSGWQGKYAIFHDIDFLNDGTVYASGRRNPVAGNTLSSLFLLKLTGVEAGQGSGSIHIEEEILSSELIRVYPNPGIDILNLDIPKGKSYQYVNFFSADGQLVKNTPVNSLSETLSIPVDDLRPGIYFIHLVSKEGHSYCRYIKQ